MIKDDQCASCERSSDAIGRQITLTEFNGKKYCDKCIDQVKTNAFEMEKLNSLPDSEKLTQIMIISSKTLEHNRQQTDILRFIKTVIIIGIILCVIGFLFKGCSPF